MLWYKYTTKKMLFILNLKEIAHSTPHSSLPSKKRRKIVVIRKNPIIQSGYFEKNSKINLYFSRKQEASSKFTL